MLIKPALGETLPGKPLWRPLWRPLVFWLGILAIFAVAEAQADRLVDPSLPSPPQDLFAEPQEPSFADLLALRDAGEFEAAIALSGTLLEAAPNNADVLLIRGQVLGFVGRFAEAQEVLEQTLSLVPDYADAGFALARIKSYQGDYEAAQREAKRALAHAPGRIDGWLLLAGLAAANDDRLERDAALAQAERIDANHPELLIARGDWFADLGDLANARAHYERRIEMHGRDNTVIDRLNRLDDGIAPKWTWTSLGSASSFTDSDRESWREWFNEIRYQADAVQTYSLRLDYSRRFGTDDLFIATGLDHRFSERWLGIVELAATPDADFRPHVQAMFDLNWQAFESEDDQFATAFNAGVRLSRYDAGTTKTLGLGVTQYFSNAWVSGRLAHTLDEGNNFEFAWSLRLDVAVTSDFRIFVGGGVETEHDLGQSFASDTLFAGFNLRLRDNLSWFVDVAVEDPDRGPQRRALTSGFSIEF